jgi:hypothetical protein
MGTPREIKASAEEVPGGGAAAVTDVDALPDPPAPVQLKVYV